MARNQKTPEQIESIAQRLIVASETLKMIADSMREGGMPDALIHSTMPENTHIPAIEDWADKLKIDVRSQIRSYVAGVQSKAELNKQKTVTQNQAAARKTKKKPSTPKTAKKVVGNRIGEEKE
ncbi:hypothetical protein [Schlesneria sp. T3-172]|uniref:hypothetical protein n=1 Tax=Schlesneria sphaerica TaxID=3373610 RepID=UPI0037C85D51